MFEAFRGRPVARAEPFGIPDRGVGALAQQQLHHGLILHAHGGHERGAAARVRRVEVCPVLVQQLERVQVPSLCRQDQRRGPVPVLRVGADALGDQPLHGLELVQNSVRSEPELIRLDTRKDNVAPKAVGHRLVS